MGLDKRVYTFLDKGQRINSYEAPGRWILEYITRLRSSFRREVYESFHRTGGAHLTTPCTVFHVRRSDIKGHGKRKYHKISDFVKAAGAMLHDNILLLTDDQDAIDEAQRQYPHQNWMYFNRTRFRGTEGGWENHFPSGDPKSEVMAILSTFQAVKECDSIVIQEGSFARYIMGVMKEYRGDNGVFVANIGH